jgi:integrase/recombinase XerD
MIPIGERAVQWVEKYLSDIRPELATGHDEGILFLSHLGQAIKMGRLRVIVRRYVD